MFNFLTVINFGSFLFTVQYLIARLLLFKYFEFRLGSFKESFSLFLMEYGDLFVLSLKRRIELFPYVIYHRFFFFRSLDLGTTPSRKGDRPFFRYVDSYIFSVAKVNLSKWRR